MDCVGAAEASFTLLQSERSVCRYSGLAAVSFLTPDDDGSSLAEYSFTKRLETH
jgi:hypothetical protein